MAEALTVAAEKRAVFAMPRVRSLSVGAFVSRARCPIAIETWLVLLTPPGGGGFLGLGGAFFFGLIPHPGGDSAFGVLSGGSSLLRARHAPEGDGSRVLACHRWEA